MASKSSLRHESFLDYDIIIMGGGMAGLTQALLLAPLNKRIAVIDQAPPAVQLTPEFDGRTVAISNGSGAILDRAGVWQDLKPLGCPITDIQIMENGSACLLEFLSQDVGDEPFGWIFENRHVRQHLFQALERSQLIDLLAPAKPQTLEQGDENAQLTLRDGRILRAPLLIGADGRGSWVRDMCGISTHGWPYNQHAIVVSVRHEQPHNNIAIEDFRNEGPFAVLPMRDDPDTGAHRSAVVWTEHGSPRRSILKRSEDEFISQLNDLFPDFYGEVELLGRPAIYPLGLTHAERYVSRRVALIADAAHGIHPIAGQGLNIGLRDTAVMADLLQKYGVRDPGEAELLQEYERARRIDNMAMVAATDSLNKLFSNNFAPVRLARRLGLRAVQRLPFAKKFFMTQAMGKQAV